MDFLCANMLQSCEWVGVCANMALCKYIDFVKQVKVSANIYQHVCKQGVSPGANICPVGFHQMQIFINMSGVAEWVGGCLGEVQKRDET